MPARVMLIDPDGNEVKEGWRLAELRRLSGLADPALLDFLCRSMGYASIFSGPSGATVWINPVILQPTALASLLYWIADSHDPSIVIRVLDRKRSQDHTLADRNAATKFMIHLTERRSKSGADRFFQSRLPIDQAFRNDQFRYLLGMLQNFSAPHANEFVTAYLRQHFAGRFAVFKCDRDAGRILLEVAGSGFTGLASDWAKKAIGRPIDQLYDQDYGAFVAEAFAATARSGLPTLDDIDAIVRTSTGTSNALSYRRLIVPLSDGALLGVTLRSRDPIPLRG